MKKHSMINYIDLKFADDETIVALGQWLGVFPDTQLMGSSDALTSIPLSVDEYLRKYPFISDTDKNDISIMISNVLTVTGTHDKEAEITVTDYKAGAKKFNYRALNTDDKKEFIFNLAGDNDTNRQIGFSYETMKKSYSVKNVTADIAPDVDLLSIVKNNPENGNKLGRLIQKEVATIKLQNKEDALTITISRPSNDHHKEDYCRYVFTREEELYEYLLNLSFPINLDEEYVKIFELTGISDNYLANYEYIRLAVNSKTEKNITDVIDIEKGELVDYKSSAEKPAISEEELDHINKVNYCIHKDYDTSLARTLTDSEFTDMVFDDNNKKPKGV